MADRLAIEVVAEIKEFERKLAMLPEVGGSEARKLAGAIRREMAGAESAVGRSSKGIGQALEKAGRVGERAFRQLGSAGRIVGDALFQWGKPLAEIGTALGGVGVGLGGVAAAGVVATASLAAVYLSAKQVTDQAVKARDRLEAQGLAATIPPEALHSLATYQAANQTLRNAVDELTIAVGAELAPALAGLAHLVTGLVEQTSDAAEAGREWLGVLDRIGHASRALGAVSPMIGNLATVVSLAADATKALGRASDEVWLDYGPSPEVWERMQSLRLAEEAAARRQAEIVAQRLRELEALEAAERERARLLVEVDQEMWDEKVQNLLDFNRVQELLLDRQVDAIIQAQVRAAAASQQLTESTEQDLSVVAEVVQNLSDGITEITDLIIEQYERRVDAGAKLGAKEVANANRLFRIAQASQITAMTVNAISTYFALARDLATIPGNAVSAPFEAAAIVVSSMIAPAVSVLGQDIPFPFGSVAPTKGHEYTAEDAEGYDGGLPGPKGTAPPQASVARTEVVVRVDRRNGRITATGSAGKSGRGTV